MRVRDAVEADLPVILAITNQVIRDTTALWTDDPLSLDQRRTWFLERRGRGFPVLVAEEKGEVLGYASYGDFRSFQGYRHTVELSLHVAEPARGRGVGRTLLTALIGRAEQAAVHVMVAGIEASNLASIRLHASLGFVETGRMPEVGKKFGRWLDLVLMQRIL